MAALPLRVLRKSGSGENVYYPAMVDSFEIDYAVRLDVFEGPLDLLVYLVQKNELDPLDIPIAVITDQYLETVERMADANLSRAGEFLVMASRLMRLKARELLPKDEQDELDQMEYELDRNELIQQMLEYRKFKEASNYLRHLERQHYGALPRGLADRPGADDAKNGELPGDLGLYDLLEAFTTAMKNRKVPGVHTVEIDDVTIETQIERLERFLEACGRFHLEEFLRDDPRRIVLVVSFMALLELSKLGVLHTRQHRAFAPIWVTQNTIGMGNPAPEDPEAEFEAIGNLNPGLAGFVKDRLESMRAETKLDRMLAEMASGDADLEKEDAWRDRIGEEADSLRILPDDEPDEPRAQPALGGGAPGEATPKSREAE